MNKFSKCAFIAAMALICYTGFATAQAVSFDSPEDLGTMVKELKAGRYGGNGGGFGNQGHGNNNPGNHNGPGNNNNWHPQPSPWNPQPNPSHGQWHPHYSGHPDWNNNNWNNNHWNNHGPSHNIWWTGSVHPYSMYRTVCEVTPGISAKGYIVEQTMPFYGKATFYYYNVFNTLVGASNTANRVYSGGNGTPVFDFYQVPLQADHCFMGITR